MKHTTLVPHVLCTQCGKAMYRLNTSRERIIYGCTNGHMRTIPRPGQRITTQRPPNDAA